MPLSNQQRAELEGLGPETVRIKLLHAGPGRTALVPGLDSAPLRGDVESWLAEKSAQNASERKRTLWWAMVAGWGVIATVVIGIVTIGVMFWLAK